MLAEQAKGRVADVAHFYCSLYSFHDSQADLVRHAAKTQQRITILVCGIFTHYWMIKRLLTVVDGFSRVEASFGDLYQLNDPILSSARFLK